MLRLHPFSLWLALCVVLSIGACSTQTVKTTTFTPMVIDSNELPEDELLDVGISLFDPGLDDVSRRDAELTFADVRRAESFYTAHLMTETLQSSGNWGVVRVIPGDMSGVDVSVYGTLLQSDGETMRVQVRVEDATGREWFDREYEEVVSRYSYDPRMRRSEDAFQGLYNRIANDMLEYRKSNLTRAELLAIRDVSRIRFASSFAPNVYGEYLSRNRRSGLLEVTQLPAENDPIMLRIQDIRDRDNLFVDTLQEYYGNFAREMETPYTEFRRLSYDEVVEYNKLRAESRRNMVLGVAAILGGLAATQGNSSVQPLLTYGGIAAGAYLIRDAIYTSEESKMHVQALAELGSSLETEVTSRTIELEERTITLTGNVEAQYEQWREILADMYTAEIGEIEAASP